MGHWWFADTLFQLKKHLKRCFLESILNKRVSNENCKPFSALAGQCFWTTRPFAFPQINLCGQSPILPPYSAGLALEARMSQHFDGEWMILRRSRLPQEELYLTACSSSLLLKISLDNIPCFLWWLGKLAQCRVVSFPRILVAFSEFTRTLSGQEGCLAAWDSSRLISIVPSFQYLCLIDWKIMALVSSSKGTSLQSQTSQGLCIPTALALL